MRIGNWPLILMALEHIIKHPDLHRQCHWRSDCGTYRCLAGWIALFAGYQDVPGTVDDSVVRLAGLTSNADIIGVEDAALTALELDHDIYGQVCTRTAMMDDFAQSLFNGDLDIVDILTVVRDLARADGVTPTPIIVEKMLSTGIVSKWDVA